jgi:hypothetical protein
MLSRRRLLVASIALVALGVGVAAFAVARSSSTASTSNGATTWYVSRNGNNADGTSWATAWSDFNDINWSSVHSGDTIVVDGGSTECTPGYRFSGSVPGTGCGMEYTHDLAPTVSNLTIKLSTASGHDGTAVLFGGNSVLLPYCSQQTYTGNGPQAVGGVGGMGNQYGIVLDGVNKVTVDGSHASGIMVWGWQNGVYQENSAIGGNTFERMEIFDNGIAGKRLYGNSSTMPGASVNGVTIPAGGYQTDGDGILVGAGPNLTIRGDIIHDNGQDDIHSTDNITTNQANGLTLDTDWLTGFRESPLAPGEPYNDLQAIGYTNQGGVSNCTHVDGIQMYSGTTQSGMTVDHTLFGPLINQGLYLEATWTHVSVTDSLFMVVSHNIVTDTPVNDWALDHDTLFAEQGGFKIPTSGPNSMTNIVKYGGSVSTPNWTGTTNGNVWYSGDPLPGSSSNQNPDFVGPVPSGALNGFPSYAAANFAAQCAGCQGSSLHTLGDIVSRIESLSP